MQSSTSILRPTKRARQGRSGLASRTDGRMAAADAISRSPFEASPRVSEDAVTCLPPMVTRAPNFEDVMLRRVLQDVEGGFYVDIGAAHPVRGSVTAWF